MKLRKNAIPLLLVLGAVSGSRGDEMVLRGGTRLQGLLLEHKSTPRDALVLTSTGLVRISRALIVRSEVEGEAGARYAAARKLLNDRDGELHYELALWCRAHNLLDECRAEIAVVLNLQPDHAAALRLRTALPSNPRPKTPPLTGDVPAEPSDAPQDENVVVVEDPLGRDGPPLALRRANWNKAVPRIASGLKSNNSNQVRQAREELEAIRDPMAVEPLMRILPEASGSNRELIVRVLADIPGPESTAALAIVAVLAPSPDLRWFAVTQLKTRDRRAYLPLFNDALRRGNRETILNAADAAAQLETPELAAPLIAALTTTSTYRYKTSPMATLFPTIAADFSRH